ncbi:hypothetical protein ACFWAY_53040 [Rhodococcus sp. NPDC059968]|uniref:hypothetical protein n=1 Tax=Rhodococcus sp. NPDC059968 TaxID=3347017 RepID=UPI00366AFAFD
MDDTGTITDSLGGVMVIEARLDESDQIVTWWPPGQAAAVLVKSTEIIIGVETALTQSTKIVPHCNPTQLLRRASVDGIWWVRTDTVLLAGAVPATLHDAAPQSVYVRSGLFTGQR